MRTTGNPWKSGLRSLTLGLLPLWLFACSSGDDGGADGSSGPGGSSSGTGASTGSGGTGGSGAGGAGASGGVGGSGGSVGGSGGSVAGAGGSVGGSAGSSGSGGSGATGGSGGAAGKGGAAGSSAGAGGSGGAAGSAAGSGGTAGIDAGGGSAGSGGKDAGTDASLDSGTGGGTADGGSTDGGSPGCSSGTATSGETTQTITVGSLSRSFIRHIPPGYTGKAPVPVMFDIHGLGSSGTSQKNQTGWGAVADAKGFIIVWPNGYMNSWNVGRCCNPAQSQNVDDVAFFKAVVAQLAQETCMDPKRVYATGCSNGGGMSYKLACDAADTFAAIAPVDFDCITGPMSSPSCAMCSPSRPITEVQFRGTSDTAVPYNGGKTPVVSGLEFPGAPTNFATWGQINMCTGTPTPLPNNSACQQYPMCAGGVQTTLCTVQNGTHCGAYQSFDIANVAWAELQKYSLP